MPDGAPTEADVLALFERARPLGVAIQQRRPERGQPVLAALDGGPQIGLEAGGRVFSRTHRDPIEQAVQLVLQHRLQGVHLRTSRGPIY